MAYPIQKESNTVMKAVFILIFTVYLSGMITMFLDATREESKAKEKAKEPCPVIVVE